MYFKSLKYSSPNTYIFKIREGMCKTLTRQRVSQIIKVSCDASGD